MKKAGLLLIIICACLVSVWIVVKKYDRPAVPKAYYTIPRSIQYSFTLQNKTNRVMNEAEFWAYAPEPVKTAENIFRWIAGNVQYAGYIKNVLIS